MATSGPFVSPATSPLPGMVSYAYPVNVAVKSFSVVLTVRRAQPKWLLQLDPSTLTVTDFYSPSDPKLQLSTGTVNSTRVTEFDANGNTVNSDLTETSNVLANATTTQSWSVTGGADASANSLLGSLTLRGADQSGAGGASAQGGDVYLRGGNNAATNAASQGGSVMMSPGASTGSTQGLQGLSMNVNVYIKAATSTLWDLACGTGAQLTAHNCGASPANWLGVIETVGSNGNADLTYAAHTLTLGASGILDLSAASATAGLKIPSAAGAAPTADGIFAFDTTAHLPVVGSNGATLTWPNNKSVASNQFLTAYNNVTGVFSAAQPSFANLSGSATLDV